MRGIGCGINAPPETAVKLVPLLGIREQLQDSVSHEVLSHVFQGLLGYPGEDLTDEQKAARKELVRKFPAMRNSVLLLRGR